MYSHLGRDEEAPHPAFLQARSIWWAAVIRLSLPIGEISLSRLSPCPSAESQLLPTSREESRAGQAGGQGGGIHLLPWL